MKKIHYLCLAGLTALASCSSDDFVGGEGLQNANKKGQISFSTKTAGSTRADKFGADAATLLNRNFVVMGTKGGDINTPASVVTGIVFDHYNVNWTQNTAETTASNTADWEYVNQTKHTYADISGQEIKYWDFSAGQYDFIAYSGGNATLNYTAKTANELYVTPITPSTATSPTGGAYTVAGAVADLENFYMADLVTAYNPAYTSAPTSTRMGNEVQIRFRNITAKVRVGLYETVPGYAIRDVEFYASDGATTTVAENKLTLYSQSSNIYTDGTFTVYYPTVDDASNTDYNKAHVTFAPTPSTGSSTTSTYAALDYNNAKTLEDGATQGTREEKNYLGENSNSATYVTSSTTKPYTTVIPNETATALTLRVNYTLVANDGSRETIKVYGAKAVIPAQYCQWKSNYAYTYLFKISDNTNGQTQALGMGTVGLVPLTFDAVTAVAEDGLQETVTTVATPSITTYMKEAPNVTANDEYPSGKVIYVMVQEDANLLALGGTPAKGQLYKVTGATTKVPATEANVMDALNMNDGATPLVGRNGLTLTTASSDISITAIPGVNGNDITVDAGKAASFTGEASTTYAYVYTVSDAADTEYNTAVVLTAEPSDWDADDNVYYTDFNCTAKANITYADGTYYKKLTNKNTTYAVKVIKVAS